MLQCDDDGGGGNGVGGGSCSDDGASGDKGDEGAGVHKRKAEVKMKNVNVWQGTSI